MKEAAELARAHGLQGFQVNQVMWSMAKANPENIGDRTLVLLDEETRRWQAEQGMALMAYTSLAHGYPVRRVRGEAVSPELAAQYDHPVNEAAIRLIREAGADPLALCLRFIAERPQPALPVAAFSSEKQLR